MYAMTLSIMKPRILRDSPPFQAGVGLEMLSPGGYMPIILHVGPLSTANPGFLDQGGQFLDIRQFFAIQGGGHFAADHYIFTIDRYLLIAAPQVSRANRSLRLGR